MALELLRQCAWAIAQSFNAFKYMYQIHGGSSTSKDDLARKASFLNDCNNFVAIAPFDSTDSSFFQKQNAFIDVARFDGESKKRVSDRLPLEIWQSLMLQG